MHLLYIIGQPGVGKSTLTEALVRGRRRRVKQEPFTHTLYEGGLVQLGRERSNGFSGTDALSLSAATNAIALLEARWPRLIAEGDRLATGKFFDAARKIGYNVDVVLLEAPAFVLTKRRQERGSEQNEAWARGRETKIKNLDPWVTIRLDATLPVEELTASLRDHPVFERNGN
jgi:GTPase SAR1 family protein